jgi:hypothetical protein
MSEGWSSAQTNQTLPHASLAGSYLDVEEDPAFRRCPVRADVSQAEAGYGYGYGAYGYHHYRPHYSYSYSYCHYVSRPVTILVWDDYSYSYIYKTIYRSYKVC